MAKGNKGGNNEGFEANLFLILLASILLLVGAWFIFGKYFSAMMGVIRKVELSLFAPVFEGAYRLRQMLVAVDGNALNFADTKEMLAATGSYVRWLYIPFFAWAAVYVYIKANRGRFNRRHSMTSLVKQEAALWPEIAPVAGKQDELVEMDIHKGPWSVAMTEWEFAEKHSLAVRDEPEKVELNREKARDVFIQQLGPVWTGHQKLPKHARAIYAAFLLRIGGDSKGALEAFRRMSASIAKGGLDHLDTSHVDDAIAKHGNNPLVLRALAQHAYTFPIMATLLQISRQDGVLASPLFLWLKTVDRRLWYTLNNVGRYAFHVECAGIMAHWLFEKSVKEAVASPMVEKAVDGLALALREYRADDSLDRLFA